MIYLFLTIRALCKIYKGPDSSFTSTKITIECKAPRFSVLAPGKYQCSNYSFAAWDPIIQLCSSFIIYFLLSAYGLWLYCGFVQCRFRSKKYGPHTSMEMEGYLNFAENRKVASAPWNQKISKSKKSVYRII